MSYIKNEYYCKFCNNKVKYYWCFPDCCFEVIPKGIKVADQMRINKRYKVSVKCDCGRTHSFEYDFTGKYIGEWSGGLVNGQTDK